MIYQTFSAFYVHTCISAYYLHISAYYSHISVYYSHISVYYSHTYVYYLHISAYYSHISVYYMYLHISAYYSHISAYYSHISAYYSHTIQASQSFKIDYLEWRACISLLLMIILIIFAISESTRLVTYFSLFSKEIFTGVVALFFIIEASRTIYGVGYLHRHGNIKL